MGFSRARNMSDQDYQNEPDKTRLKPRVLVVDRDEDYGQSVVACLGESSICARCTQTVDAFLDLNFRKRIDLVLIEVDALDPESLDNLRILRTHFGEGPGTRIVAASTFVPDALSMLVEQRGADQHMVRKTRPQEMAAAVKIELSKQLHRT